MSARAAAAHAAEAGVTKQPISSLAAPWLGSSIPSWLSSPDPQEDRSFESWVLTRDTPVTADTSVTRAAAARSMSTSSYSWGAAGSAATALMPITSSRQVGAAAWWSWQGTAVRGIAGTRQHAASREKLRETPRPACASSAPAGLAAAAASVALLLSGSPEGLAMDMGGGASRSCMVGLRLSPAGASTRACRPPEPRARGMPGVMPMSRPAPRVTGVLDATTSFVGI
mmetsp:Transcript_319/g.638  ORF Transcript_319/g.638 Transcript_319/m.638 type:complete len:227 (+) Transcript_319:1009-1689(+)